MQMESSLGLFDLPGPLLTFWDQSISGFTPAWARILLLSLVSSGLSMGLYAWVSPQKKLKSVSQNARQARNALIGYDGEFDGLIPLVKQALGHSFKHLSLIVFPALLASLPLLCILVWLSNHFDTVPPSAGETVCLEIHPANRAKHLNFSIPIVLQEDQPCLSWPDKNLIVIRDAEGRLLVKLDVNFSTGMVHKKVWWNLLNANPAGYLPDDMPVEMIIVDLKPLEVLSLGSDWMRGWPFVFLVPLLIFSIVIKIIFRIE
jgi:hypothetical protein